jgi:hypothetical protein
VAREIVEERAGHDRETGPLQLISSSSMSLSAPWLSVLPGRDALQDAGVDDRLALRVVVGVERLAGDGHLALAAAVEQPPEIELALVGVVDAADRDVAGGLAATERAFLPAAAAGVLDVLADVASPPVKVSNTPSGLLSTEAVTR